MNVTLVEAYLKTTYKIYAGTGSYDLRVDEPNADFQNFCKEKGITHWAVITAYNPCSEECSSISNRRKNDALQRVLKSIHLTVLEADGIPDDSNWETEKSYFSYNLSLEQAQKIGRQFQQNAIVYGKGDGIARLFWIPN